MSQFHLMNPGWGRAELEQETLRVYDICDGCRRCFNLCPSFNTLLNRIDDQDSDLTKLTNQDFEQVEKECYSCKLCFNHCPYTPPHQYALDFPHLMTAWKQQRVKEQGVPWRDRLLVKTDFLGKLGTLTSSFSNWALVNPWIRKLLERVAGIHHARKILPFERQSFSQWWQKRAAPMTAGKPTKKVVLFPSCLVNYQAADIGKAMVQVLEANGVEVKVPDNQSCCGMPHLELGDTDAITQAAQRQYQLFGPYLDQGYDIVSPVPSCSLMFKREYPYLTPHADISRMAERMFDVCEYLMGMKKEGILSTEFPQNPGHISYQIPCHLRDQNIGFKSKELMELTGATVHLVERCSGHDGTWGVKTEFFDMSIQIAKKAIREIEHTSAPIVASDCPLSALQLDQAQGSDSHSREPARHPIQIVRDAYGLTS